MIVCPCPYKKVRLERQDKFGLSHPHSMGSFSTCICPAYYLKKCCRTEGKTQGKLSKTIKSMASLTVTVSMQKACSTAYFTSKHQSMLKPSCSLATKQAAAPIVTLNIEGSKSLNLDKSGEAEGEVTLNKDREEAHEPEFFDSRWKEGTWDLNMFVKNGKMDWDSVISAEARRRKFLQVYPAVSTNEAPVLFRTSIIPWWAWVTHSHLPEAELLNGRAAMIGFFMGYIVDVLTGLNVVGQTGNIICKAGLLVTIIGILLFRRSNHLDNLKKLVDEATFYDKQWQASWQDQENRKPDSFK